MTERNTGAALVFGMGLLFVYYTFVLKQPIFQAPVTQTEVGEVGGWAEPEEGIERGEFGLAEREDVYSYPESTRGELPGSGTMGREIVVRSEQLELVFSSLGASVSQGRILDHVYGSEHERAGEGVVLFDGREAGQNQIGGRYLVERVGDLVDFGTVAFTSDAGDLIHVTGGDSVDVRFSAELEDGSLATRTYRVFGRGHSIRSRVDFSGDSRIGSYGLRWELPLRTSESSVKIDRDAFRGLAFVDADLEEIALKKVKDGDRHDFRGDIDWVGARSRYFLLALLPGDRRNLEVAISGSREGGEGQGFELLVKKRRVNAQEFTDVQKIVIGPLEYDELVSLDRYVDRAVDFGGSFLRPISRVIFAVMVWLRSFVPSYGVVIILISILVKALFWPLTHKSYESAAKMRALAPELTALKAKYQNNQQKQQQETMKVYKEHGVNPLGGCLPMLVQMPVLYAMFIVFRTTIAFRGQSFLGYIPDLSAPDPYWIMPLLMGVTMLAQARLNPVTDANQRMMAYGMPVMFTFFFLNMPSGLVLYWTVSNVVTMGQQYLVNRTFARRATVGA